MGDHHNPSRGRRKEGLSGRWRSRGRGEKQPGRQGTGAQSTSLSLVEEESSTQGLLRNLDLEGQATQDCGQGTGKAGPGLHSGSLRQHVEQRWEGGGLDWSNALDKTR